MKKVKLISTILLFFVVASGETDNVGTSSANFLKIGVGSRAEAMGSAFTGQADDVSALYWNPAGLSSVKNPQIMFSQTQWLVDINHLFIGIAWPVSKQFGSLGLSVIALSMDDLEETTEENPQGTGRKFPAGNMQIGMAYARDISDRFSVGIHAKYIQETISFSKARAVAIDVGTRYITNFMGLKLGMAITNFGSEMTMEGTDLIFKGTDIFEDLGSNPDVNSNLETKAWPLPTAIRIGYSIKPVNSGFVSVTVNGDYFDPRDFKPYFNFGAEVTLYNTFYLRSGIVNKFAANLLYDEETGGSTVIESSFFEDYDQLMSFGFGVETKLPFSKTVLTIDYSYSEQTFFTGVHRYTISLNF